MVVDRRKTATTYLHRLQTRTTAPGRWPGGRVDRASSRGLLPPANPATAGDKSTCNLLGQRLDPAAKYGRPPSWLKNGTGASTPTCGRAPSFQPSWACAGQEVERWNLLAPKRQSPKGSPTWPNAWAALAGPAIAGHRLHESLRPRQIRPFVPSYHVLGTERLRPQR